MIKGELVKPSSYSMGHNLQLTGLSLRHYIKLEFQESDVLPGKTEVKQGEFVKLISPGKWLF